jgi:hypothetical protein
MKLNTIFICLDGALEELSLSNMNVIIYIWKTAKIINFLY